MAIFLTEKKTNHRRISDPQIIYDGALCDNIISGSHFALTLAAPMMKKNRKAASLCYYLQFHEKIGSMGEEKYHIGTFFLFLVRGKIIYCFLCWETVLLRYINSLILEILEWIVRASKAWKFVISKHEIFSATNFDSKNCVFNHQSRGN